MLQALHEHIKGWIAGVVIGLISLSFVLWGVQYYLAGDRSGNGVIAKVNGEKITEQQITRALQQLQQQQPGVDPQLLKQAALQNLILDRLLVQAAQRSGFRVSRTEADQFILSFPQWQDQGRFSPQRYQQFLYTNSLTPLAFLEQIQTLLLLNQVQVGIQNSDFALPNEVKRGYQLLYQTRDLGYFIIPAQQFVSSVTITMAEMERYYQQHKNQFSVPEKVSVEYIVLSPQEISQRAPVSEADIQRYYQENLSRYSQPLDKVSATIRKELIQQKTDTLMAELSDQLTNLTYTNPTTLAPAAQALQLKIKTSEWFTRKGDAGIAAYPKVVTAAFSDSVLRGGNNSDLIALPGNAQLVLRIQQRIPSQLPPFKDVVAAIKPQIQQELAKAQAMIVAGKIQTALNQGTNVSDLASRYRLTWQSQKAVSRHNKIIPDSLLTTAFRLTEQKGQRTATVALPNGDAAVVLLAGIHLADDRQVSSRERQTLKQDLADRWGQLNYQFYVQGIQDRAKIKITIP